MAPRHEVHVRYAVAMTAVGVVAGLFGIVFRGGLGLIFHGVYRHEDILSAFQAMPRLARFLLPIAGAALSATIGVLVSRGSGGHGMGQILEAVVLGKGRVSVRAAAGRAVASFVAIVSGGSIGREGPLLQFGAAAGGTIGERFELTAQQGRALVAAGTAAGFAAAYNTPIAAVLFVVEIVVGVVTLDVVLPVVVATTISTWLSREFVGNGPLYGLRQFSLVSGRELLVFAALGVLTGLVGPLFMESLAAGSRLAKRVAVPVPVQGALGGVVVGALSVAWPQINGNGYETIQQMLDARYGALMMAVLLVAKGLATTASVSSGSPGGVFTPSLFLGAAVGGLVGFAAPLVLPAHGSVGGYVLVGMAGAIAATTHAPVMASVLGFELAGDYGVVLPLFIATVLATQVSRRLRVDSIYTEELRRRGIPWERSLEEKIAGAVRARDILEKDPFVVAGARPVQAALDILAGTQARVVFVTGGPAILAIDLHQAATLWSGASTAAARPLTCAEVAVPVAAAFPDDSLLTLSQKLFDVDWGEIPVVEPGAPGRLLGMVSRRALLATFDREFLRRDLLFTRVVWTEGQSEAADYLELPRGHRVEVIAPPPPALGEPVDACRLRAEHRVTLLAVRPPRRSAEPPAWIDPDRVTATSAGDRWMVVGTPADIEKLRQGR